MNETFTFFFRAESRTFNLATAKVYSASTEVPEGSDHIVVELKFKKPKTPDFDRGDRIIGDMIARQNARMEGKR